VTVDLKLTRRALMVGTLGLAGAGVLAACGEQGSDVTSPGTGAKSESVPIDVAASEQALIDQYGAAITAFPALAPAFASLQSQHQEHLAALGVEAPAAASSTAAMAATGLEAAILGLMEAERQASRARRTSCGATADPELARTLTFIAASEASHVPALRQLLAT
jgi:hypothetical protein